MLLRSVLDSDHVIHIPASEDISIVVVTRFINRVVLLYMKDLLIYKLTMVEFILLFQEENIFFYKNLFYFILGDIVTFRRSRFTFS